jgi:hypothetical protein
MVIILRHDARWLWGYLPKDYGLYNVWYENVKTNRLSNYNLKYWHIDTDLREQKRREWNEPVLWPIGLALMALVAGLFPALMVYRRKERGTGIQGGDQDKNELGSLNA